MARRGGKKRKAGIKREANGRASRRLDDVKRSQKLSDEMSEAEAKSVALEARMRHTGLKLELLDLQDAGRPNAGTVHGVLLLRGDITKDQYTAAEWYIGRRCEYFRCQQIPDPDVPRFLGSGHGDEDKYESWVVATKAMWSDVLDCIQDASTQSRSPLKSALDTLLARQVMVEHQVGDLRLGLNAITRRFIQTKKLAMAC
jgi:hypothetical protein